MQVATPVCLELAIEIDNYTRNTFSTNQETLDWALAILSGVSQLYQAQTNVENHQQIIEYSHMLIKINEHL